MDPMIVEFCRVRSPEDIRPDVLRRWQQYLRHEVQPRLDTLARLMTVEDEPSSSLVPVRRGPGRPRKEAV